MKPLKLILLLVASTITGIGVVVLLFLWSENIIHYQNRFIRRFPQHVAQQENKANLIYNSYYFAGTGTDKIYLGNYTAPLQILEIDADLKTKQVHQIELIQKHLPFQSPQIRVQGNTFFVFEGLIPYIFSGTTKNWKASLKINSGRYFSHLEPINSTKVAIRYLMPKTGISILGTQNLSDTLKVNYNATLLQKQFDGIFDTDGELIVNAQLQKIIYTYRYRNQFIVSSPNLSLNYRGKTIDTISKAQIKLAKIKNSNMKTFAVPPLVVNKLSTTNNNLLYINSLLPGQYESKHIWKIASIIDVYKITDGSYRSSFPVYDIEGKKIKDMLVFEDTFYALIGNSIVSYKLKEHLTQDKSAKELSK